MARSRIAVEGALAASDAVAETLVPQVAKASATGR